MARRRASSAPTFTKDVAPIFQDKCEACHRPDSIAPMSLVTYAEARPWARSIRARVADHQMPPWNIDKSVGVQGFKNDRSLSDKQIDTILKWVDAGAPQGNPKDMPAPQDVAGGSGLELRGHVRTERAGHDRQVVRVHHAGAVAGCVGQARDALGHHRAALGARRSRFVRRRSRAARSCITRSRISIRPILARRATGGLPAPFMEWAVGKQGELMRPDTGKLLLPGSKFRWDIHYSQAGEEITNSVEMGIYFYPERPGAEVPHLAAARAGGARHHGHPSRTRCRWLKASPCCAKTRASRAISRTCTCAARR